MKIHVSASRASNNNPRVELDLIKKILMNSGHKVQIDHILQPSESDSMEKIDFRKEYKRIQKWIKASDVLIADITTPSNGVGHEIFLALNEGKPVLALHAYDEGKPKDMSLRGNPSKLLTTRSYTKENLPEIIQEFLDDAKSKLDTKFILIISPEIDKYLKWAAEERRMHKAQVVREAVDQMMKKDKEYKQHLAEIGN